MTVHLVGSFPIGGVNIAAQGAVGLIGPLIAELDLMLAFGLGPIEADLAIQLNAALTAQIQLTNNPLAAIQAVLSAAASISASFALPGISANISANASIAAALSLKLGGLQAIIAAALAVKIPAVDFLAALAANLSAGPVVVASWGFADPPATLATTGVQIQSLFTAGLPGILPFEPVYGVLITTKVPSASAALSATLLCL